MDQWLAHDHEPLSQDIEERRCHCVWKCGRCFHQISRPFDCIIAVPGTTVLAPGTAVLMSAEDAATYPDGRIFGLPIEACADVAAGRVWIRQASSLEAARG